MLPCEKISAMLAGIDEYLTSRPLRSMSNDLKYCASLNSSHFLMRNAILDHVEPDVSDLRLSFANRWHELEASHLVST